MPVLHGDLGYIQHVATGLLLTTDQATLYTYGTIYSYGTI